MHEPLDPAIAALAARREHVLGLVRAVLIEELGVRLEPDQIDPDTPLFGLGLALDSVDALDLALSLEERTGRRLAADTTSMTSLRSVNAIVDFVMEAEHAPA
ncbi:MAG: acyl carrier protein [Myxococcales bacterium]|nr:acyl carrier protein [Myxococcales bacterium]